MDRVKLCIHFVLEHFQEQAKKDKIQAYTDVTQFFENMSHLLKNEELAERASELFQTIHWEKIGKNSEEEIWWWSPFNASPEMKLQVEQFVKKKGLKKFLWNPKKNIWFDGLLYLDELDRKEKKLLLHKQLKVTQVNGTLQQNQYLKCVVQNTNGSLPLLRLIPMDWLHSKPVESVVRESATFRIDINWGTAIMGKGKVVDIVQFTGFQEYEVLVQK